jgi:hypothetical protein
VFLYGVIAGNRMFGKGKGFVRNTVQFLRSDQQFCTCDWDETHRDDLDHDNDNICQLGQQISPQGFGSVINKKKALKMHTFAVHPLHGSNGKTERAMSIRGQCDQIEGKMIEAYEC